MPETKIYPAPSFRGITSPQEDHLIHSSPQQVTWYSRRCWINWLKVAIILSLSAWVVVLFAAKIDLTTSDIGRHITNGRMFLEQFPSTGFHSPVLNTNLYSYTYPDFEFTNHHWGSGIIFFEIWKTWGFTALSLLNILMGLGIFLGIFYLATKYSSFYHATFTALVSIPLLAQRHEIRPEMFSYVLAVLVFWLLWKYKNTEKKSYWILILLPIIQLLWINLHIYFFLGFILMGSFWLSMLPDFRANFSKFKLLSLSIVASLALNLLNPFGLKGLLYPLQIFKNYGYPIVENKSIWFLTNYGFPEPNITLIKILTMIIIILCGIKIYQERKNFKWELGLLGLFGLVTSWLALRNFALFGLFGLPVLAYLFTAFKFKVAKEDLEVKLSLSVVWLILAGVILNANWTRMNHDRGLGLVSENQDAANFFLKQNLTGPIINNYDIGSYLIFSLYPKEKVFVDNRPETYPAGFFQNEYIPVLQNPDLWPAELSKYQFNTIFFTITDLTEWGQKFLIDRVKDPDWAVVFADKFSIIIVRKNEKNQDLIKQFEIPKSNFGVN